MKVLFAFCALFAATQAGLISYPVHPTYLQHPVIHTNKLGGGFAYTTIGHPHPFFRGHYGLTYPGYPLAYPSYYPSIYPGTLFTPPVVQLVPAVPTDGKKDEKPTEAPAEGSTTEESKPADVENIDSGESNKEEEPKPSEESVQADDSVSVDSA